jgi:hypothetical protein
MPDFRNLVEKYSVPVTVHQETGGHYDYDQGGAWTVETEPREVRAAVFHLSSKDIETALQLGGGGSYERDDIKIYLHEPITVGAKVTYKGSRYTVAVALDYADHGHGLHIYIAKKAGRINESDEKPSC